MGRSSTSPHAKPSKPGKGKVTPVQIAFLVDRYLSDNNFTNALSTFRSEASELFSKTKGKEVPKGLLSLGDILDDYITLKEHKMAMDQEKRKVEVLIQGIQDSVRVYHSTTGSPPKPSPPPPPSHLVPQHQPLLPPTSMALGAFPPPMLPTNANNVPSPGNIMQCMPVRKTRISILPNNAPEPSNYSTTTTNGQSRSKRRTSNSDSAANRVTKKSRAESSDVSTVGGVKLPSQVNATHCTEEVLEEGFSGQCKIKPLVRGSAVQKNLFRQLPECHKSSSPKTPPQSSPSSQSEDSESPAEYSHQSPCNTDTTPQEMTPSKCSVISSKKIIVISPFKQAGYYSVEKRHRVTSPMKSSPGKLGKREHVKSRLDFDGSEASPDNGKHVAETSTSNDVEKTKEDIFNMDFLDLGGGFCFSQLLLDFDLDGVDDLPCQPSNSSAEFAHWSNQENEDIFVQTNQDLPNQSSVTGVLSSEETKIHGPDSMESLTTVTKCIKILSPVKNLSSLEQADLQPETNHS